MALPAEKLGTVYAELASPIDPARARAYAEATNDDNPAYRAGALAPPVFGVVPTWAAMGAAFTDVVPPEALPMVVHGEQDMYLLRPLVPGRSIVSTAQAYSLRVGQSGTRFTVRVTSREELGDLPVLDQYVTMFVRGMSDGLGGDHALPPEARASLAGELTQHLDHDQTFRYRDASGDHNPIHVDDGFARAVGLPGMIVHGLCVMAMTGRAVIDTVASSDPRRLRRLAVRFAKNVFPGDVLTTRVFDLGETGVGATQPGARSFGFEATTGGGDVVVTNGRAEVV